MKLSSRPAVLSWLLLATVTPAFCANPIETDRPDYVESSSVVGRGLVQIETGMTFEQLDENGVRTRTLTTPSLLRLGIGDTLELRLESDGFTRIHASGSADGGDTVGRTHGFSDLSLGVKWRIQESDESTGAPGLAWLLHVDAPSGSSRLRGRGWRPSLRGVAEWDLPNDFSVGVMPGVVADETADGRAYLAGIFAVTLGKAWTPNWHSFVEIAGQHLAAGSNGGSLVTLDAGVSRLLSDSVQVDAEISRTLTEAAPTYQVGAGISVRF
jgi:hypothetical protein